MSSFEEQTAAAIKRLVIWFTVLSVFVVATLALATWGFLEAQSAANQARQDAKVLAAQVHSPSHVKNVLLWCDAINADRAYNRAFVKHVTRGRIPYTLPALPCEAIANKTRVAITK